MMRLFSRASLKGWFGCALLLVAFQLFHFDSMVANGLALFLAFNAGVLCEQADAKEGAAGKIEN